MSLEGLEEAVIFSEWRSLRRTSSRSLARTAQLMQQLGYAPSRQEHLILGVVGSKGKGTASAYASAALAGLGHRVGTVMSPGVLTNADRIRVNGAVVDDDTRRRALLRIQHAKEQLAAPTEDSGYLAPTGLFLLMGLLIFAESGVDVVVAEAGIGGASDDLSHWPLKTVVVTGIFGEHLDILGPSIADVARDKSAVITERTQCVVSCAQSREVAEIIARRCASAGSELGWPTAAAHRLIDHLPEGFQRENAAAGIAAAVCLSGGMAYHGPPLWSPSICRLGPESEDERHDRGDDGRSEPDSSLHNGVLASVVRSVQYPGRLSVHEVPGSLGPGCVVDSAVSPEGLRAALEFAHSALQPVEQVLVCLAPDKDLAGAVAELKQFDGRKVFVEMPGAYIGTPERRDWPIGPEWGWIRLEDLGDHGVHQAPGSAQLLQLLSQARSLAVGTVLFTSLVLRTLGVGHQSLFTLEE